MFGVDGNPVAYYCRGIEDYNDLMSSLWAVQVVEWRAVPHHMDVDAVVLVVNGSARTDSALRDALDAAGKGGVAEYVTVHIGDCKWVSHAVSGAVCHARYRVSSDCGDP